MGRTRAEQRVATREQIRAAAWELFSKKGFDETTTQAIAKRAGVASGTVFVHASDKADLLFLVMHDRLVEAYEGAFATMPAGAPLLEKLMHVFRAIFRMYGEAPRVAAAFVRSLPGAKGPNADRVRDMTFGFFQRLAELVAEAQKSGEVAADLEPIACVQNVFGLYFMVLLSWLDGLVPLEALDPMLARSLALQIRGFRP